MSKVKVHEPEGKGKTVCRICGEPERSVGLCGHHYHKFNKYGDPLAKRPQKESPARDWFYAAMDSDTDDCQIWPFTRSKDGYPRVMIDGRFVYASRYACEIQHGPPPTSRHQAAHTCGRGRQGCINKRHVVWKTPAENIADKHIHGTALFGSRHHQAKLTEDDVREIRRQHRKVPIRDIAANFGVARPTVENIVHGVTWRHV